MNNTESTMKRTGMSYAKPATRSFCFTTIALVCAFALSSCGKHLGQSDRANSDRSGADPSGSVKLAPVEVPAAGKKFDPPVRAEQLPLGAWYCDMGTVHWAQMDEGNHTCPFCKMDLKQKK